MHKPWASACLPVAMTNVKGKPNHFKELTILDGSTEYNYDRMAFGLKFLYEYGEITKSYYVLLAGQLYVLPRD